MLVEKGLDKGPVAGDRLDFGRGWNNLSGARTGEAAVSRAESSMMTEEASTLVGRRVRIVTWAQGDFVASFLERTRLAARPVGTIRHVSPADRDVWVQVDGLKREYAFGMGQLELLP